MTFRHDVAGPVEAEAVPSKSVAPSPPRLAQRSMPALVARARAGDPGAVMLLRQVVTGERPAAAPAAAQPAPCRLTDTTVQPVPGDLSDDEALEATRQLPEHVPSGNGGGTVLGTDCHRREFMRWGREWFGTYRATIDHFNAIERANVPGNPYVHRDTKARLEAVAQEIGAEMPSTTTAFAFRATFRGKHPSPLSMHTLGYALDYDAVGMPQMGRNEMALLIELMTGGPANAQILDYGRRRAAIRRMGDRTAAGENATAGDANAATVVGAITTELERITRASAAFQNILGTDGRAQFLELRTQYFEAAAGDRAAILTRVQPLLQPLFDAITTAEGAADVTAERRALLASLRNKLRTDASFLFGARRQPPTPRPPRPRRGEPPPPPAPTPRPTTAHTHTSPSLAQLFERGWFTPGTTGERWGIRFAESMARHGFEGGYVWGGATQDSMHFELVVQRPFTPPAAPRPAQQARGAAHGQER